MKPLLFFNKNSPVQKPIDQIADEFRLEPKGDLMPVLSVVDLLKPHTSLIDQINELVGISEPAFMNLYQVAINQFARFVQLLPASEVHHHAGAGGLLTHSLEVATLALKIRRSYLLSAEKGAEQIAKNQDLWTYAVFTGALCHDLGKPVIDQQIVVFLKPHLEPNTWNPYRNFIDQQGGYFRNSFVRDRKYALHEKVTPLMIPKIIPLEGLEWLSSVFEIYAAWLSFISGDRQGAQALGEIIQQADGQSVAKNLGAGSQRLSTAKVIPLHEKLMTALRHLLSNRELPLNRNGAAGWIKHGECWLVSKRTIDALRLQLTQEGHTGIPTQNSRLFDVLQEHNILIPCAEKAIWRVKISDQDWQNELTVIRIPLPTLWPNSEGRPEEFAGEISIIEESPAQAQNSVEISQNSMPAHHEAKDKTERLEFPVKHLKAIRDVNPEEGQHPLLTEQPELPVKPSEAGHRKPTELPPSKVDFKKPGTSSIVGEADDFLDWLHEGIETQTISINNSKARLHVVKDGALLMTPGIFQAYAKDKKTDWLLIQKNVLKKNWHQQTEKGLNIVKYQVSGQQKSSVVNGILIPDLTLIFGAGRIPKPNPHLSEKPL